MTDNQKDRNYLPNKIEDSSYVSKQIKKHSLIVKTSFLQKHDLPNNFGNFPMFIIHYRINIFLGLLPIDLEYL